MAIFLNPSIDRGYYYCATNRPERATHVAWPVDELPRLAADIHRTVIRLAIDGAPGLVIDATIVDLLRGATPDAARMPAAG